MAWVFDVPILSILLLYFVDLNDELGAGDEGSNNCSTELFRERIALMFETACSDLLIVNIGGVKTSSLTVRRRRGPAESVPQTCRPSASLSRLEFGLAFLGPFSILLPVQLQTITKPHNILTILTIILF